MDALEILLGPGVKVVMITNEIRGTISMFTKIPLEKNMDFAIMHISNLS